MDFEAYLFSKKIDSSALLKAEPELWKNWKLEFEQIHPKSFTAQKLYLINPIRRRYPLPADAVQPQTQKEEVTSDRADVPPSSTVVSKPKPVIPRPVFKPKPKTD